MFEGFKAKFVPGLYNFAHYERADGSWIQIKHGTSGDRITGAFNDGPTQTLRFFNSKSDLVVLLTRYHSN